ncbi:unnamed protein product [Acanthosepion pharaonis]|uniref:Uncharacterized protein n=1 Tax=Acanthosepion pharaonis TaxID=158019 RepID=A0A812CME7_ACAPH|nr:unnamed protein product [Sepia pharaonis]
MLFYHSFLIFFVLFVLFMSASSVPFDFPFLFFFCLLVYFIFVLSFIPFLFFLILFCRHLIINSNFHFRLVLSFVSNNFHLQYIDLCISPIPFSLLLSFIHFFLSCFFFLQFSSLSHFLFFISFFLACFLFFSPVPFSLSHSFLHFLISFCLAFFLQFFFSLEFSFLHFFLSFFSSSLVSFFLSFFLSFFDSSPFSPTLFSLFFPFFILFLFSKIVVFSKNVFAYSFSTYLPPLASSKAKRGGECVSLSLPIYSLSISKPYVVPPRGDTWQPSTLRTRVIHLLFLFFVFFIFLHRSVFLRYSLFSYDALSFLTILSVFFSPFVYQLFSNRLPLTFSYFKFRFLPYSLSFSSFPFSFLLVYFYFSLSLMNLSLMSFLFNILSSRHFICF